MKIVMKIQFLLQRTQSMPTAKSKELITRIWWHVRNRDSPWKL